MPQSDPEEKSNTAVGERLDVYLARLWLLVNGAERTKDEKMRLGHLFTVITRLRPYLTQYYETEGFPRTNNEMERTIRTLKMQYRRISGRKNWNAYLLRYGRCVAYRAYWVHHPQGEAQLEARLRGVPTALLLGKIPGGRPVHVTKCNAIASDFVIGQRTI